MTTEPKPFSREEFDKKFCDWSDEGYGFIVDERTEPDELWDWIEAKVEAEGEKREKKGYELLVGLVIDPTSKPRPITKPDILHKLNNMTREEFDEWFNKF